MAKRRRSLKRKKAKPARVHARIVLFRVVSDEEFRQVMKKGRFVFRWDQNSVKWFAESRAHAVAWGKLFSKSGIAHDRIVKVELDRVVADRFVRNPHLDGIGPARCATLGQLSRARIKVSPA